MASKTDTAIYHGRRSWYVVGLALSILTLAVTSVMALKDSLNGWELSLFKFINSWPDGLQTFFSIISASEDAILIGAIAVVATFVIRQWRLSWRLSASIILGSAIVLALKYSISRARPNELVEGVHLRWIEHGAGYPSGHVAIMTIVMLSILPYLPTRWRWVVPLGILLMALSRIYLGAHAPLDAVGGFAVGLFVVCLIRIMPQSLRVLFRLD